MARQVTITLDEDVAARVEAEAQRTGAALQDVVNLTLRRNLKDADIEPKPFKIRPRRMGHLTGLNLDCMAKLLNEVEGPNWK